MADPLTIASGDAFFALPEVGSAVEYLDGGGTRGKVYRINFDTIAIETRLGQTTKKSGYEGRLKFTLPGFHRAHALGPIVGHESPHGIYFTPGSVNSQVQAHGIEKFVGEIGRNIRPGQKLYLTATVVRESLPHKVGNDVLKVDFLKHITYTVHTEAGQTRTRVFEAGFDVTRPSEVGSRVSFSAPYISPDLNKHCNVENVLARAGGTGVGKAVSARLAKAKAPLNKSAPTRPAGTDKPKTAPAQGLTNPATDSKGIGPTSRATRPAQRAVSRRLTTQADKISALVGRFYANAGRAAIKRLPLIFKGLTVYNAVLSIYSILDAYNIATKVLAYGTPIPELRRELGNLSAAFDTANRAVTEIYENNILQENHPAIEDELYNNGDMEGLYEITSLLEEDQAAMRKMKDALIDNLVMLKEVEKQLAVARAGYIASFGQISLETASKGVAILMEEALRDSLRGVILLIQETQSSIDALDSLIDDYGELISFYNESAWTLSILRKHDMLGYELPKNIVKPTKSLWGPNVLE